MVAHFFNRVDKLFVLKCFRGMIHHAPRGAVEVFALVLQEARLGPMVACLARAQQLWNSASTPKDFDVLHQFFGAVLRVQAA